MASEWRQRRQASGCSAGGRSRSSPRRRSSPRHAGELVPARVVIIVVAVRQGRPHHLGHRFGDGPELQGAVGERRPRLLLGGDVDAEQVQVDDRAAGLAMGDVAHERVAPVAAGMGRLERDGLAGEGPGEQRLPRGVGRLAHDRPQRRPTVSDGSRPNHREKLPLAKRQTSSWSRAAISAGAASVMLRRSSRSARASASARARPISRAACRRGWRAPRPAAPSAPPAVPRIEHAEGAEGLPVRARRAMPAWKRRAGGPVTADRPAVRPSRARSGTITGSAPARRASAAPSCGDNPGGRSPTGRRPACGPARRRSRRPHRRGGRCRDPAAEVRCQESGQEVRCQGSVSEIRDRPRREPRGAPSGRFLCPLASSLVMADRCGPPRRTPAEPQPDRRSDTSRQPPRRRRVSQRCFPASPDRPAGERLRRDDRTVRVAATAESVSC